MLQEFVKCQHTHTYIHPFENKLYKQAQTGTHTELHLKLARILRIRRVQLAHYLCAFSRCARSLSLSLYFIYNFI